MTRLVADTIELTSLSARLVVQTKIQRQVREHLLQLRLGLLERLEQIVDFAPEQRESILLLGQLRRKPLAQRPLLRGVLQRLQILANTLLIADRSASSGRRGS